MNPSHEQVLADIERLVGTEVALDETDTRIAEVLGVPPTTTSRTCWCGARSRRRPRPSA
jgi:hypothetical protein